MAGYKSSAEYYKLCNPVEVMHKITAPFLLINSEDDSICMYQNALDNLGIFKNSPSLVFVGTKTGSVLIVLFGKDFLQNRGPKK